MYLQESYNYTNSSVLWGTWFCRLMFGPPITLRRIFSMNSATLSRPLPWFAFLLVGLSLPLTSRAEELSAQGCWSGQWKSCSTGHQGPMKATLTDCGEGKYRADFKGRFFKIVPFKYSVTLRVIDESEDVIQLGGSSYLGRMFGTFQYTATVTASEFKASYRSKKDSGVFTMSR
jgi:hypothetical protein